MDERRTNGRMDGQILFQLSSEYTRPLLLLLLLRTRLYEEKERERGPVTDTGFRMCYVE